MKDLITKDYADLEKQLKKKKYEHKNGVLLCAEHHKKFHSKYGVKDNTPMQYEEYKNEHRR